MEESRALVHRAAAGDRSAWHDLYVEHARPVHAFLARRVDRQAAEDLTTEVFLKAFRALPGYVDRGVPLRVWLLRIAYNLVVDESRRRGLQTGELPDDAGPVLPSAESHVVALEDSGRVQRAVASLPDGARAVVELRFLQELSIEETAAVLGVTADVVRARSHRGLRALRSMLTHEVALHA